MKHLFTIIILAAALLASCSNPQVSSPDGRVTLSLTTDSAGQIYYQVDVDDSTFIAPSRLGLTARDANLASGFTIRDVRHSSSDSVWHQPWGENKEIRDRHNAMTVSLDNSDGVGLTLSFKLFDDGLGFRYSYTVPGADSIIVTDELTQFAIADSAVSWSIPANFDTYELEYREMPLAAVATANTPMTFKTRRGTYASIHEAALTDYPEMTLRCTAPGVFKADLAPWPDGVKARYAGDRVVTPWRSVQIAREAVGLINSPLILNLNDPCVIDSTEWIRPMKYVGIWWGLHLGVETWQNDERHGATTENAKRYIDFAADNNIEGVVFEGWNSGWESWGGRQSFDFTKAYDDFDVTEVVNYARQRGVQIISHHETGANIPNYERQLEQAYAWCDSLGIHYVKTGYAGGIPGGHCRHGQYAVRHYRSVVQTAARHEVSLDVHEPIKDTGIRRTYPNMMTREGAKGMEWNAWSSGNTPAHEVTLPFTRLLSGPMDYTPGTFDILYTKTRHDPRRRKWNDLDRGDSRVNTTLAKQIANWVILYSPLQMASDMIENYEGHPAFQFFRDFDADCDWSRALQGEPGQFIAVVRRAGDRYFLGASTGYEARTLTIPLDFLESGRIYDATIYADGEDADWRDNPTSYRIDRRQVTAADTLTVVMARGGGQAVTFIPAE